MNKILVFLFAFLVFVLPSCSGQRVIPGIDQSDEEIDMGQDWPISTPADQNMDAALLEEMKDYVDQTKLNLHSLLVIRNGCIILEEYYPGHNRNELHIQYSVTKSFVSTLFGISIDQGQITSENLPVKYFFPQADFPNPDPRKDAMVLSDLLTMQSGLDWLEGDQTYAAMYRSSDWVEWVMGLPQVDNPGDSFVYCSGCSHILLKVIEQATGLDAQEYADEFLFSPIGIKDYEWERTPQGDLIGGWGLSLTARDMARLGFLYLRDGKWGDRQLITKGWVEKATSNYIKGNGRLGYGYQWWIDPTHAAYAALGRDGQTIYVIPDLNMIVVTTAQIAGHDPILELIDKFIVPAATRID